MRALSALFLLSLLFLFANLCHARKDLADYWKSAMEGEPMPKEIEELLHGDPSISLSMEKKKWHSSSDQTTNMKHFNKDFDTRPSNILYHSHIMHVESKKLKPCDTAKPVKPEVVKVPKNNKAQEERVYAF